MSTIKVDNLDTRTGTGNITLNRPLVGDGSGLTSLTAANLTGTIHADRYTDTVYTHPTTAGNKHIPSGGATNQVLTYSSSGTASWVAPAAGLTSQSGTGNYALGTTGALAITGVGFQPTCVFFNAVVNSNDTASIGFMDSDGLEYSIPDQTGTAYWTQSGFLYDLIHPTSSDRHKVSFTSYDVDGFTLSRAETGSPGTNTVYYVWLALK